MKTEKKNAIGGQPRGWRSWCSKPSASAPRKCAGERLSQALLETSIELQARKKNESLGLEGSLYGRHLTKVQRETLRAFIDESRATERVIGTLKREEINLQEQYANETEAKNSIGVAIRDCNMNQPNQGNGGHSPNAVHHLDRAAIMKRRTRARQKVVELRRNHWEQVPLPSSTSLT